MDAKRLSGCWCFLDQKIFALRSHLCDVTSSCLQNKYYITPGVHIFYNSIRQKSSHCSCLRIDWNFPVAFPSTSGTSAFSIEEGKLPYHKLPIVVYSSWQQKSEWTERGKSRFFHKTFKSTFLRVCAHFHSPYPSLEARSLRANLSVVPFYRWFCSQTFPRRHIFCETLLDRQSFGAKKAKIGERKKRQSQSVLGLVRYQVFLWGVIRSQGGKVFNFIEFLTIRIHALEVFEGSESFGENFLRFIKLEGLVRQWSEKVSQLQNY